MLTVLLYHQVDARIRDHLTYFATHSVLPGDPLAPPSVCLTFDDATEDFYRVVFPLLKELKARALLAVPAGLIDSPNYCTWDQLKEIAQSGLVEVASHSMSHPNLILSQNLQTEIMGSKQLLEKKLGQTVRTFVYPFGKFN